MLEVQTKTSLSHLDHPVQVELRSDRFLLFLPEQTSVVLLAVAEHYAALAAVALAVAVLAVAALTVTA